MKGKSFKVLIMLVSILVLLPSNSTQAEQLGGKWTTVNPSYYVSTSYSTEIQKAITSWNGILANIGATVRYKSNTVLGANVTFAQGTYSDVYWTAYTDLYPSSYSTPYTAANIRFKTSEMSLYTSLGKQAIACHELGHALGLAHTIDTSTKSIMLAYIDDFWGIHGISSPQMYDQNELNVIY